VSVEGGARALGYGSINASISASMLDDYEAQVADLTNRVNNLAADLLEERAQRREVGEALVRVTEERDVAQAAYDSLRAASIQHTERHRALFDEQLRERARLIDERDEARDEVVRLGQRTEYLERDRDFWREQQKFASDMCATIADLDEVAPALRQVLRAEIKRRKEAEDENDRLRTIIVELGAGEAAEPEEQVEALRPEDER
jgi:chromosome segregation ATPase